MGLRSRCIKRWGLDCSSQPMRPVWPLSCESVASMWSNNSRSQLFIRMSSWIVVIVWTWLSKIEDSVILEIKAIQELAPIHDAQLLSYLRLSGKNVGLIINFHVRVLKDGLKRVVNEFPDSAFSATSAVNTVNKVS